MDIFRERLLLTWSDWPWTVIDLETDGVDPLTCAPVELAIVRFELGKVVHRWSTLINPGRPIPEEASTIHGITDDMVADAPDFEAAMAHAIGGYYLDGDTLPVAYHAPFDRAILHRLAGAKHGHRTLALDSDLPWVDPLVVVRHVDRFVPGKGRHKLEQACARRGIEVGGAHRALADAEACGLLLCKLYDEALGEMTVGELLRKQQIRAAEQEAAFEAWKAAQPPRAQEASP